MPRRPRRPLIAVPARFSESASALRYRADVTARALLDAIYAAGGEPLVVHPVAPDRKIDVEAVAARFWFADGIVLPGGGDLAAHWSGQQPHATQYDVDEEQDAFDLAVARFALENGVPLLAICRGTQVVNVGRGGDLVQDLGEVDHRHLVHEITVDPSAALAGVTGTSLAISCYHHQSLGRLGAGLRPVARASDGVIEAVDLEGSRGWFLGLQWHPEDTAATDPDQAALFGALVDAARARRSAPRP